MDDHSSKRHVAATPLAANPDFWTEAALWRYPERSAHAKSLFGIAPGGACHAGPVASPPVGSYSTVSPLPQPKPRRSILCGAIRQVSLPGRYPAPLLPGVRTFLEGEPPRSEIQEPPPFPTCVETFPGFPFEPGHGSDLCLLLDFRFRLSTSVLSDLGF